MSDRPIPIEHEQHADGGKYIARIGSHAAEMTYRRASPQRIVIDHTFVPPELRGRGIGEELVQRAVSDARASEAKIEPVCPFVAAQFRRNRDFDDVLAA